MVVLHVHAGDSDASLEHTSHELHEDWAMSQDGQELLVELGVFEEPPPLSFAADDDNTVQYVYQVPVDTGDEDDPQSH